jgi:hypothetical protein
MAWTQVRVTMLIYCDARCLCLDILFTRPRANSHWHSDACLLVMTNDTLIYFSLWWATEHILHLNVLLMVKAFYFLLEKSIYCIYLWSLLLVILFSPQQDSLLIAIAGALKRRRQMLRELLSLVLVQATTVIEQDKRRLVETSVSLLLPISPHKLAFHPCRPNQIMRVCGACVWMLPSLVQLPIHSGKDCKKLLVLRQCSSGPRSHFPRSAARTYPDRLERSECKETLREWSRPRLLNGNRSPGKSNQKRFNVIAPVFPYSMRESNESRFGNRCTAHDYMHQLRGACCTTTRNLHAIIKGRETWCPFNPIT